MLPKHGRRLPLVSLVQKVAMLSPTVVVAWSGGLVVARRVLTDLREFVDRRNGLSSREILEFLGTLPYNDWKSLSLLGLIANSDGNNHFFWSNVTIRNFKTFGFVAAGGSGVKDLFKYLDKLEGQNISIPPLELVGPMALSADFLSLSGLSSGYGGGYEIADRQSNQITKRNHTLYAFWFLEEEIIIKSNENDEVFPFIKPAVFIKHIYVDDILLIVRAEAAHRVHTGRQRIIGRGKLDFLAADLPFIKNKEKVLFFDDSFFDKTELLVSVFFLRMASGAVKVVIQSDSTEELKSHLDSKINLQKKIFDITWKNKYWLRLKEDLLIRKATSPLWI